MEIQIELAEQILNLTGTYTPPDPGRMYYPDGSGQPPSPAEFEIEHIEWMQGDIITDITELIFAFNDETFLQIEDLAIAKIES